MIEKILHPRIIENKDWATILFVITFALVAVVRAVFETRFEEFSKLLFSNKYIKIYKDTSNLLSWFNVILFAIQIISLAFLTQLLLNYLGYIEKTDWLIFIRIITFIFAFIIGKFLIEKIIATAFDIEEFEELYNLQKISYRSYISLIILPINIILFYNENPSKNLIITFIGVILITNLITYLISLKNYQNLLLSKFFYFILYLCALEIAPYYFMYYWFTKN